MDDLFVLLYIISVSAGRWESDNGRQFAMKPFNRINLPKICHGFHDNDKIKFQWKRTFSTCI